MTKEEIMAEISNIDYVADVKQILSFIDDKYRQLNRQECNSIYLNVGTQVQLKSDFQSRKPHDRIGTVVKVNRVKVKVKMGESEIWNIPKSMLQVV